MKAKSRRRLLLSSVAMLLVAMLALGTATFAWFATKTTADANAFVGSSAKASGLLISESASGPWGSTITYSATGNSRAAELAPASTMFESLTSPVFKTAVADDPTNYATTGEYTNAAATGYYNVYKLFAKTADGASKTLNVSVDSLVDEGAYGRFAIVRHANAAITGDADALKVYYKQADSTDIYPITSAGEVADAYPKTPDTTVSSISLGTITGDATEFTIYVWNEGQDADCKSVNAGKALTFNLDLALAN